MSDVLLGVIIGSVLSIAAGIVTEVVRGNREAKLDAKKRADNRNLAHDAFQRETLLAFQDALLDWIRLGGEHHLADKRAYRGTGEWGKNLVGEDQSDRERAASRNLTVLRSRIDDDDLRARIGICQEMWIGMLRSNDPSEADRFEVKLAPEVDWCLTRAGELIRSFR